jgi:predicted DsbA family dithiol-disulfide isomerase
MFGPAKAAAWFQMVNDRASALGLSINWDGLCGNTRDSHVLLLLAQKQQQQQQQQQQHEHEGEGRDDSSRGRNILRDTQDALFDGVFDRGRDVSDRHFLAEVALEVGLCESEEVVFACLDEPAARAQADALDRAAKKVAGITAVPSYVVQGRYSVGGQQDSEVFLKLFDKIRLAGKATQ